jgi:SAM-dependent methyltransferase
LQVYRALVRRHLPPAGRALDLGCGHASWLLPELAGATLAAGVDPDLRALRRHGPLRDRVVGLAERLPFADAQFDLVTSAWVFEHLDHPRGAMCEVARVLRPGGKLVFLTPNAWNYNVWVIRAVPGRLHEFFTFRLYGRERSDTYRVRYRLNSPRRVDSVLREAGLARCEIWLNGDPTYAGLNRLLFVLACGVERLLDLGPLRQARVHLLGVYEKV